MAFTDVSTGQQTLASQINQYADALNGTTAALVYLLATAANTYAQRLDLPSVPTGDQPVNWIGVSGDITNARIGLYIRSDGYGGLLGGLGSTPTAHLYAVSNGWKITESLTVTGSVTASAGLYDGTSRVAIQGPHSAGQPLISYGNGAPSTLAANEIYIQLT